MSRKIIGITVGTQLPKPNFKQTDPTKGDYIKNKPDFDGLKTQVTELSVSAESYLFNIDYDATLAFDITEIVFGDAAIAASSPIIGQGVLEKLILA